MLNFPNTLRLFILIFINLLLLVESSIALADHGGEHPIANPRGVAPGAVSVSWIHSGSGVVHFHVAREKPPFEWSQIDSAQREIFDSGLQPNTIYRYVVCAFYNDGGFACSQLAEAKTWPAESSSPTPPETSPSTSPASSFKPVLSAVPAGGAEVNLAWTVPPSGSIRLSRVPLYRDGTVIYEALQLGNLDTDHADGVRPNSTHRYKICFEGSDIREVCSAEISAGPTPVAPTAPAEVRVERGFRPGGRSPEGIVLRPRHFVSITWRNSAIPGIFLTVERNDERTIRNPDPNSPVPFIRQSLWNEIERLNAGTDPTSVTVDDVSTSVDPSLRVGKTYRVCAVVPALGDAGKICSQTVNLPSD